MLANCVPGTEGADQQRAPCKSKPCGEAGEQSDVDLLIDLDEHTFDRYMDLKFWLEDLLERRVDLVLIDGLKPRVRDKILGEAIHAA